MSENHWHAFLEDDDDGNVCIYLQNDKLTHSRELFKQIEVPEGEEVEAEEENQALADAEAEAKRRNG
jgi:hypothetical protein